MGDGVAKLGADGAGIKPAIAEPLPTLADLGRDTIADGSVTECRRLSPVERLGAAQHPRYLPRGGLKVGGQRHERFAAVSDSGVKVHRVSPVGVSSHGVVPHDTGSIGTGRDSGQGGQHFVVYVTRGHKMLCGQLVFSRFAGRG